MRFLTKTNRSILGAMVRTDFKLRYQNSLLGYAWSLLRPLLLSTILYIVFVKFLRISGDIRHYASYLLLGIMCWTFFLEVTSNGVSSIVGKGELIRKIAIPRYLIVVSSSVSALINFSLNLIVLIAIMLISGVEIQVGLLLFVPLLLIQLYIFSLSVAFILSAAFVRFRDVSFIWEVFTQMYFYITPIIYPVSYVIDKYDVGRFILLNPLAQIIQDLRYILVTPQTQTSWQLFNYLAVVPVIITLCIATFAIKYFKKESVLFAENV